MRVGLERGFLSHKGVEQGGLEVEALAGLPFRKRIEDGIEALSLLLQGEQSESIGEVGLSAAVGIDHVVGARGIGQTMEEAHDFLRGELVLFCLHQSDGAFACGKGDETLEVFFLLRHARPVETAFVAQCFGCKLSVEGVRQGVRNLQQSRALVGCPKAQISACPPVCGLRCPRAVRRSVQGCCLFKMPCGALETIQSEGSQPCPPVQVGNEPPARVRLLFGNRECLLVEAVEDIAGDDGYRTFGVC